MNPEYHINLTKENGAKYAILPGDPARTEQIASYFDSPEEIAFNREFRSFSGLHGHRRAFRGHLHGGAYSYRG